MTRLTLLAAFAVGCTTSPKVGTDTAPVDTDVGSGGATGLGGEGGGSGGTGGSGGSGGSTPTCTATLVSGDPTDGSVTAPLAGAFTATFSSAITPTDAFSVSIDGVTGSASLAADGLSATFTPDAPLTYETTYTTTSSVCGGAPFNSTFTTVPPPLDASTLIGNSYGVLYADLVWITPTNADFIEPDIQMLVAQVTDVDLVAMTLSSAAAGAYVDAYGAVSLECAAAVNAGTGDFSSNPFFFVGPVDLDLPFGALSVVIEDYTLFAKFAADGTELNDVFLSGKLDMRPLGYGNCALLAIFAGGTCVPCADGVEECMDAKASAGTLTLQPVDIAGECGV